MMEIEHTLTSCRRGPHKQAGLHWTSEYHILIMFVVIEIKFWCIDDQFVNQVDCECLKPPGCFGVRFVNILGGNQVVNPFYELSLEAASFVAMHMESLIIIIFPAMPRHCLKCHSSKEYLQIHNPAMDILTD
jgi:hypothetical protein